MLSQQIGLVGLGSGLFTKAMDKLNDFDAMFTRYFHGFSVQKLAKEAQNGVPGITASNRFFTSKKDFPNAEGVPFGPGVDPLGLLELQLGDDLIHSTDNSVGYFKRLENAHDT